MRTRYDRIGVGYGTRRQADPRWDAAIRRALVGAATVVNVGAGTGSYEPDDLWVVAVEPSATMIAQRPPGGAAVVRATAEGLPLRSGSFDAALAILTAHHWADAATGLAELQRVASRQVVLTWDAQVTAQYWLMDYVPEIAEREVGMATLDAVVNHLDVVTIDPLPVPADCADGVLAAYWCRPHAYLDPSVRAAISGFAMLDPGLVTNRIARLAADLEDGTWTSRHGHLLGRTELDVGYRLVVAGRERDPDLTIERQDGQEGQEAGS